MSQIIDRMRMRKIIDQIVDILVTGFIILILTTLAFVYAWGLGFLWTEVAKIAKADEQGGLTHWFSPQHTGVLVKDMTKECQEKQRAKICQGFAKSLPRLIKNGEPISPYVQAVSTIQCKAPKTPYDCSHEVRQAMATIKD